MQNFGGFYEFWMQICQRFCWKTINKSGKRIDKSSGPIKFNIHQLESSKLKLGKQK